MENLKMKMDILQKQMKNLFMKEVLKKVNLMVKA